MRLGFRARGVHQAFEQRAELAGPVEVLRMPLHAETEAFGRIFDGFDDAVGRGRAGDEPFSERHRRLMMAAV